MTTQAAVASQAEWIVGLAARLVARGWGVPAPLVLHALQSWGVLGSQVLILAEPLLGHWAGDVRRLAALLEQPEGVRALAEELEREQGRLSLSHTGED